MSVQSAGILAYRILNGRVECFLVHPGGPFFKNKDDGSWSIPKGEFTGEELPLLAARREFFEETGIEVNGDFKELTPVKLKSGKVVYAWAVEFDFDATTIKSNEFKMEWPPRSGKFQFFPEVDRGEWFLIANARQKINLAQVALVNQLEIMVRII